jgi:hypothetical protein
VAVGHYKPINSDRFVNDCHEFIFHFSPHGRTPLDRRAVGVPYQDQSNIKRWAAAAKGSAAAAIPGSSLTTRFKAGIAIGRTRHHFRKKSPSNASGFTG